jgi:flagellar FliL protein
MSNAEKAADATASAPRRGLNKIVLVVVAVICTAAGAAVPWVVSAKSAHHDPEPAAHGAETHHKTEAVPFGEVIVNLNEERMTRYLRVKIVLEVDTAKAKEFTEHLEKVKPGLKSWLIGHLSGKSLKDVGGSIGVKRLQREILEHFEEVLTPTGEGPLKQVLFEEYAVQ